jgi:photosystem II stability/assembly factor-like uncharacterized protein
LEFQINFPWVIEKDVPLCTQMGKTKCHTYDGIFGSDRMQYDKRWLETRIQMLDRIMNRFTLFHPKTLKPIQLLSCLIPLLSTFSEATMSVSEDASLPPIQQYGSWNSSVIGGGGYVMDVVPTSDPTIYYCYTDVGGFYRSEDGGENWHMMHAPLPSRLGNQEPRGLVVDPRDPNRFLVACGSHWAKQREGIYLSEDGGKTYTLTLQAAFAGNGNERMWGHIMAIDPNQPDRIIAASMMDGVFLSLDFGKTWEHTGLNNINPTDLHFDNNTHGRILLCAQPYGFWLLDEWVKLSGGLYESMDSGVSWKKFGIDENPWEMVQGPEGYGKDEWIGIFPPSTVKHSLNGGKTWSNRATGLPGDPDVQTHDGNNVITPEASIMKSTFNAITAAGNFVLLGAGDGSLYQLTAGKDSWTKIPADPVAFAPDYWYGNPGTRSGWKHFGKAISSLRVDPHEPSRWWMCDWYMLWDSNNSGLNWNYSGDGIELTVIHNLTQVPDNPDMIHLGMCDNGYLRSTNSGKSYQQIWNVITNNIKDLQVHPLDNRQVYAIGPDISGHWYSNHVFRSEDDGNTWISASMQGLKKPEERRINSIALDPSNLDTLFICVDGLPSEGGGVFRSTDRGEQWTNYSEGLEDLALFKHEIWYGGREIAVSSDGSKVALSALQSQVYYRPNEQQKWIQTEQKFTHPKSVQADPFLPGHFLMTTQTQGVFSSTDGGVTWTQCSLPRGTTHYVVFDQVINGRIAVSTDDGIFLSTDGGISWSLLDRSLPNRNGNPLAFVGDKLAVGTSGCGAFWIVLNESAYEDTSSVNNAPEKALVWNDEFDSGTDPGSSKWSYENGFCAQSRAAILHERRQGQCSHRKWLSCH